MGPLNNIGWGAGIRTPISSFKGCGPAVGRLPNIFILTGSGGGNCTPRPFGYEPNELLLLYPAIKTYNKIDKTLMTGALPTELQDLHPGEIRTHDILFGVVLTAFVDLAPPAGLEPAPNCLEGSCPIHWTTEA